MRLPLVVCVPAAVLLLVQSPARAHQEDQLSAAQAQQDFDVLRHALEEAHGGLYRFATPAEVDRRFNAYRARLTAPNSQLQYRAFIAEVVAGLRDGHERIEYDATTTAALASAPMLPLRVAFEEERVFVISNDTPHDSVIRPGMELISINGRSMRNIIDTLLPLIPGDGFIVTGKRARLARSLAQTYWLYIDTTSSFAIRARTSGGAEVSSTLRGVSSTARAQNSNGVNAQIRDASARLDAPVGNITLTFHEDSTVARLRIRAFDGESFKSDVSTALQNVRRRGSSTVILDLRGNGGGVDLYGAFLVSQFVTKPFRYFDRIHLRTIRPSFATWKPSTFDDIREGTVSDSSGGFLATSQLHAGVSEQLPADTPFTGTLIVLIDGGSFSTTADVAATLHHLKRARFVGEETGGGYEGNTSGLNAEVILPNSKLHLKIMMYDYFNAVNPAVHGRGTMPDVAVTRRTVEVMNGVDAPLQRALGLAADRKL